MSWIKSLLASTAPLIASLPSGLSNGGSLLGTLDFSPLSLAGAENVRPQTRHFDFELTRGYLAPDGVNRSMLLVNGQYPGPTIEANLGDTITVTVTNHIDGPKEASSLHWHGLPQKETPYSDGVPFVTQCPIAPGSNYTYTFKAEVAGTTWWHAHFTAQYTDGMFGALIIHGKKYAQYDIDLGPVFLNDFYHLDHVSYLLPLYDIPPVFMPVDSNLINGRMFFDCSLDTHGKPCTPDAAISKFRFKTGKTHLLRLINSGGATNQHFSIDGHELTVISNDFTPIEPYKTKVLTLGVGQRADVLVKATGKDTDAVWMRSDADVFCYNGTILQPNATAGVYYPRADKNARPKTQPYLWDTNKCLNDAPLASTKPLEKRTPPTPDLIKTIDVTGGPNKTGHNVIFMDGSQFRANFSEQLLLDATHGKTEYPDHPEYNVHNYGSAKAIRLIIKNWFPLMHTMHLHGHADFWVLAEGEGEWDGTITNPENPLRRDSAQMRMGWPDKPAYLVIQYDADNPGVWPLHCHLVMHVSTGMFMNLVEHPETIATKNYDNNFKQTCDAWKEYSKNNPLNQFDSGLRMKERDFARTARELRKFTIDG